MGRGDIQPKIMQWVSSPSDEVPTPQEAFAANIRLYPCGYDTPTAQMLTPTWLVAGPTFGCVLVNANCDNAEKHNWLIVLSLGLDTQSDPAHRRWTIQGGGVCARPANDYVPPHDLVASVPFWSPPDWLSLPPDTYMYTLIGTGPVSPSAGHLWYSTTREFIAVRCEGALFTAMNAEETAISGHKAWIVEESGITTIVVSPANDWPVFFSGTATPPEMRQFAQGGLAHIDMLLPKPE